MELHPTVNPDYHRTSARRVAAALLFTGLGLAACSSGGAQATPAVSPGLSTSHGAESTPLPTSSLSQCTAERLDKWTGTPANFRIARMAQELGVSPQAVADGVLAYADCARGVPVADIASGKAVTVSGIPASFGLSDRCLLVISDVAPDPGAIARHVGVVCPLSPDQL